MNDTPENPSENTPKVPFLSSHPFVTSGDVRVSYSTDCPTCEKQTQWSADVTGSWCHECYLFVSRDTITDGPIITSDNPPQDVTAQPVESGTEDSADWTAAVNALRGALGDNPLVLIDLHDHKGGVARHYLSDPELEAAIKAVIPHLPVNVQTVTQHAGGCDWGGSNPTPENPPQDIIERPVENVTFLSPRPPCPTCGNKAEWFDNHPIPCPECGWYTMKLAPSGAPGASQSEQVGIVVGTTPEDVTIRYCTDTEDDTLRAAHQSLLEDDELEKIVLFALSVRRHTEQELVALVDWASDTKLRSAALNVVLNDLVAIEWKGNQPVFRKKP